MARDVVIPYAPRHIWREWHQGRGRESVIVAHRRAGKTVAMVNEKIRSALTCPLKDPRTAYIAPTYKQAKYIAWDYAKRYGLAVPGAVANESELRIDFPNGGRFRLLGQDDPDSLRGGYLDDVGCDEFQMWHPRVYGEILRPMLVDRRGRASFSGTPAGTENALHEVFQRVKAEGGFARIHRASETGLIPAEELDAARKGMSEEQFAQEFECSWTSSILGSIYGKYLDEAEKGGRLKPLPILPNVPVDVAFDLGRGDATGLWFIQTVGPETRLVDHYENNGHDILHYVGEMERRRAMHGYQWGTLILPHDAQHRHMTGESVKTTLEGMRYRVHVCPKGDASREIHTVRVMLRSTWIDPVRCDYGLKCLRNYRFKYNDERRTWYDQPEHDWSSHTADALRVYAVNRDRIVSSSSAGWTPIDYEARAYV